LILLLLGTIILGIGDYLVNRYLNNGNFAAINKALPINGNLTYEKVSIHPFRDFPNISLKVNSLQIKDSLIKEHEQTPVLIKGLFLNTSLTSLRKKQLEIKSIELEGLKLNVYDRDDGYSNITSLFKSKIDSKTKAKNKDSWTVDFDYTNLNIKDIELNKINENIGQNAHLLIHELDIKSEEADSSHQLSLDIQKIKGSSITDKSNSQIPLVIEQAKATVQLNNSFSKATILDLHLSKGEIDLQTDRNGVSNFSDLIGLRKSKPSKIAESNNNIDIELQGVDVKLNEINFVLVDQSKNRHLEAKVTELITEINLAPDTSAIIDLEIDLKQLAFPLLH